MYDASIHDHDQGNWYARLIHLEVMPLARRDPQVKTTKTYETYCTVGIFIHGFIYPQVNIMTWLRHHFALLAKREASVSNG